MLHTHQPTPPPRRAPVVTPAVSPPLTFDESRVFGHLDGTGDSGAHIEFVARPGTPLGGPFTTRRTFGSRLTYVPDAEIGAVHLAYPR